MVEGPTREEIAELLRPKDSDITYAKQIIMTHLCREEVAEAKALTRQVLEAQQLNPQATDPRITNDMEWQESAHHHRWIIASNLALAELQGEALALPTLPLRPTGSASVQIRTAHRGWGESFDEYQVLISQAYRASSKALSLDRQGFVLHDPDLYLARINAAEMHPRVVTALREAVASYRNGLYLGAAVLVGSASEGAWLELAMSLSDSLGSSAPGALAKEIESDTPRIERVQKGTDDAIRSGDTDVLKQAGVRKGEWVSLLETAIYYRTLRNYAIHFQQDGLERLDYGTVGILLLRASDYFNALYRVRSAL